MGARGFRRVLRGSTRGRLTARLTGWVPLKSRMKVFIGGCRGRGEHVSLVPTVAVGPAVSHGQEAGPRVLAHEVLIRELAAVDAHAPRAVALRVGLGRYCSLRHVMPFD